MKNEIIESLTDEYIENIKKIVEGKAYKYIHYDHGKPSVIVINIGIIKIK